MWFESARVEAVRDAFPEWLAFLVAFLSHLGSIWFVAPAVVLGFWFLDRHRFAPWLGLAAGGYAIMVGLKGYFATPRPGVDPAVSVDSLPVLVALVYEPAVEISSSSFPSGHAIAAVIVWTMLALEVDVGTRRQRFAVAATMVALVSLSRVVVGVHFPIDVVVGALVSATYLALALVLYGRIRARDPHAATAVVFGVAAALALLALAIGGRIDGAALFGGAVGSLLAWRYATPPREPWPRTVRGAAPAALGLAVMGLVAATLIVVDALVVWFLVGLVGGLLVVGLPAVADATLESRSSTTPSE